MCAARKAMDGGRDPPLEEGGPPGAAVATADNRDEVINRLDEAKSRYEAALVVKPDFHDATIALAQRRYERARLLCAAAGLSGAGDKAEANADSDEAEAEFSGACSDFDAVLAILPEDPPKPEPTEKKEPETDREEGGRGGGGGAAEHASAGSGHVGKHPVRAVADARQAREGVAAAARRRRGKVQGGGVRGG